MISGSPLPFRVIDKPYVLWSYDPTSENAEFLNSIDFEFYSRTVKTAFCDELGFPRFEADNEEARKDVSSYARLLWNHGLETLVTLIGAYIQAPHAVHGYFLKCKNDDCRNIAQLLLSGELPKSHLLDRDEFDFQAFTRGVHSRTEWINDEQCMANLSRAFRELLAAYARDDHRKEYNSIKHGLRARHGRSAIAIGIQESQDVPAPPEAMEMLSDSRDGSHFFAIRTLDTLAKSDQREHFAIGQCSVGWSLEKTLSDLQLISCLIGNVVGALKVAAGILASSVRFSRPEVGQEWWEEYFEDSGPGVRNLEFSIHLELPVKMEPAEIQVEQFYQTQAKKINRTREKSTPQQPPA